MTRARKKVQKDTHKESQIRIEKQYQQKFPLKGTQRKAPIRRTKVTKSHKAIQ